MAAGDYLEVVQSLEVLAANLKGLRSMLEQLALAVFEGLRDVPFRDAPEYSEHPLPHGARRPTTRRMI